MDKLPLYDAVVAGTGIYLPAKVLTNCDLERLVDTNDEWIRTRTGIAQRHIAAEDEAASDLAAQAARQAIAAANLSALDIELIIVCTSTPDILFPSTACFVQRKLGAKNAAAFDISAVCSGFVYGLSVGEQYIKSGRYRHILIVGSEVNSRILDWQDRGTCVIFGDGAGALVLRREEGQGKGVLSTHIHADGELADLVTAPGSIGRARVNHAAIDANQYVIKMNGGATFKVAVNRMCEAVCEALAFNKLSLGDVDVIVPHQANIRIIEAVGKKLEAPMEKFFINIDKYGNTSAASIAIALHEARESGRIKPGAVALLVVLGAGLTWGAALIRW